jgi:hypothetical protein
MVPVTSRVVPSEIYFLFFAPADPTRPHRAGYLQLTPSRYKRIEPAQGVGVCPSSKELAKCKATIYGTCVVQQLAAML